jgi:hypothetical protein
MAIGWVVSGLELGQVWWQYLRQICDRVAADVQNFETRFIRPIDRDGIEAVSVQIQVFDISVVCKS